MVISRLVVFHPKTTGIPLGMPVVRLIRQVLEL